MINIVILIALILGIGLAVNTLYKTYKKAVETGNPNCLGCSGCCHGHTCSCDSQKGVSNK